MCDTGPTGEGHALTRPKFRRPSGLAQPLIDAPPCRGEGGAEFATDCGGIMLIILLCMMLVATVGFVLAVRARGFGPLAKRIAVLAAIALIWWMATILGTQLVAQDYRKDALIGSVLLLDAFIGGGVLGAVVRSTALLMQAYRLRSKL